MDGRTIRKHDTLRLLIKNQKEKCLAVEQKTHASTQIEREVCEIDGSATQSTF